MEGHRRYLSPGAFGESLDKPLTSEQVSRLCRLGRIPDAIYIEPNKGWAIPEGATIKGGGIRVDYGRHGSNTGLSAAEYARLHGVTRQRIYYLLKHNRIEGATRGDKGWDIPEPAPYPAEF